MKPSVSGQSKPESSNNRILRIRSILFTYNI
jgi:hypothetical protein